jgi:hypothetical protein
MSHLFRHRLTWGHAHVALGALHHWSVHYYLCELHELGQAHSLAFITQYDRIKIQRILDDISLRSSAANSRDPSRQCGPFHSREEARLWTSHRLNRQEPTLLKELDTKPMDPPHTKGDMTAAALASLAKTLASNVNVKMKTPPRDGGRSGTKDRDHRGKDSDRPSGAPPTSWPRTAGYVCLAHDPANGTQCPEQATCSKQHLDTTKAEFATRFAMARTASEKAIARRGTNAQPR